MRVSSGATVMECPGCGHSVERAEVQAMFMGDIVNRPLHLAKCVVAGVVMGVVLGTILGAPFHRWQSAGVIVGSLLGGLVSSMLARQYNDRVRAKPMDLWPNSVTCPKCGRVFARYQEGDRPPVSAWP